MIKTYCDFCGEEIRNRNVFDSTGIKSKLKQKQIYITTLLTVVSTSGNIDCCKYCVIDSVKQVDDRTY